MPSGQFTGGPVPGQFMVAGGAQNQPPNYELHRQQEVLALAIQPELEEVVNSREVQPPPAVALGLFSILHCSL